MDRSNPPEVERKNEEVRAALTAAFARAKGTRRKATEVTADRLADHLDKHYDTTDGSLRDAIGVVRAWLEDL